MKISSIATNAFLVLAGAHGSMAFAPTTQGAVDTSSQLSMVQSGTLPCRPIGVGHAAPKTVITNTDLESVVETDDEWIRTRTGISQRRVLTRGESLRDLGIEASKQALEMAGVSAEEIDVVICATSSPEDMFGDATAIAAEIGCTTHTMAFDLTAACSGFLFGSVTAGQFLSSPNTKLKNALVIGADALSRCVDWEDRNACILFGDGAGAMVVTNQKDEDGDEDEIMPGLLGFAAHSNGHGYGDLNCL